MKKRSPAFIILLLILLFIKCNYYAYTQNITASQIQQKLRMMDTSACLAAASWGCAVESVTERKIIAGINTGKMLIPASTLKLAVTYPAWCLLKPDFHFKTVIEYDGMIKDGVLSGSIYIKGGGDPTLGSWRFLGTSTDSVFKHILYMMRNAGIAEVEGGLVADLEYFDNKLIPGSWTWEDMGNYYAGGVSSLNFNENQMEVVFQPGKQIGDPVKVLRIEPPVEDLEYENEVTTGAENSGDQVIIYGAPFDNHRIFTGTIPLGRAEFIVKGSLPDPGLEMVRQLYKYLAINNITFKFRPNTTDHLKKQGIKLSTTRYKIGELTSPVLAEIIRLTHEKSINLYTDCMLKMMGKVKDKDGSYSSGIESVKTFWKSKGLDVNSLNMKDGCGLSISNRISPGLQADMMCVIDQDKDATPFIQTLNLAGESGDLKSLFPGGSCYKKLLAKSGYMKTVRAYTGLIKGKNGRDLSFSIIVNHSGRDYAEIKPLLKDLMELFCGYGE